MSRVTLDSKCRLCRREGVKLYLKGSRCLSSKCPVEKKGAIPPGMHGIKSHKKPTDYGIQLRAKQLAKRTYGVLETQFKNYYLKAKNMKGKVGENLLILLERRLDNVVYIAGLSLSRSHAKQLISHGHVLVNGSPLSISSSLTKKDDVVALDPKTVETYRDLLRAADKDFRSPSWLGLDKNKYSVTVASLPTADHLNQSIDINLIIEYYSR